MGTPAFSMYSPLTYLSGITRNPCTPRDRKTLRPKIADLKSRRPNITTKFMRTVMNGSSIPDGRDKKCMILLVDHGSKRSSANDMLQEIAAMLQSRTEVPVHSAHMELAQPSISEGIKTCVEEGAEHIIVLPYFLSPGRHSTTDIPDMVKESVGDYSGLTYQVCRPIGTHPGIADILLDRAGLN